MQKKLSEYLDNSENSVTFVGADNGESQRLQVNITQNAAENGRDSRLGKQNTRDLQDYRVALDTLRRDDATEEERTAAAAKMEEIEQRRKAQMTAMVNASLEGIDGVSGVIVNGGIGVYLNDKGEEVVEYTYSVEADVVPQSEQAFTAAMAMVAEVSKQDSFIVNYLDETSENTKGEHGSAAQVRVKLDRPLAPTEIAQLTDMFSSLGLGLTITENEISTSNFSELSDESFDILARYLLESFNNGNAETTLQNARRVAETGNFAELDSAQESSDGTRGSVWSGSIESRKNYSDYNAARNNGKEGDEFSYLDKDGRETETDRYYGEYYTSADKANKGRVPQTDLTPEELRNRVQAVFDSTEEAMSSPAFVVSAPETSVKTEEDTPPEDTAPAAQEEPAPEESAPEESIEPIDLTDDDIVLVRSKRATWAVARVAIENGEAVFRDVNTGKRLKVGSVSEHGASWHIPKEGKQIVYHKQGDKYVPLLALSIDNKKSFGSKTKYVPATNYTGQKPINVPVMELYEKQEDGSYSRLVLSGTEKKKGRTALLRKKYPTLNAAMSMPVYINTDTGETVTLGQFLSMGFVTYHSSWLHTETSVREPHSPKRREKQPRYY